MRINILERSNSEGCVTPCWSCKGPVGVRALFCDTCGAVQPPGAVDHFTRLGLPHSFAIDGAELDRRYFCFQRRLHPDRFATKPARERALSQQQAVALNEAYETLKDPVRRAAYLLRLAGRKSEIDDSHTVDDPELLMEAMEMREALDDATDPAEIADFAAEVDGRVAACLSGLDEAFAGDDLERAAGLTMRLKYLSKLTDEVRLRRQRAARQGA